MKKLLHNRLVVAGLVAIACGSLLFNSRKEIRKLVGAKPAATKKPDPKPAAGSPAAAVVPTAALAPLASPTIRRDLARKRTERWLQSPERDPFAIAKVEAPKRSILPATKAEAFQVSAIWRQGDAQFAVINGRLVREGDETLGHLVERIENGAVFLRQPGSGAVRAEFPAFDAPPVRRSSPSPNADSPSARPTRPPLGG